jgi:hypothetical protein
MGIQTYLRRHRTEQNDHKTERLSQAMPQGCLSLDSDGDVDHLLSKYKQVYILSRLKAAGQTFDAFARKCMASVGSNSFKYEALNNASQMKAAFPKELELPSLLATHVHNSNETCRVAKRATRDSLIVFSHREETDRLMSAIKHVITTRFCFGKTEIDHKNLAGFMKKINKGECQVQETVLMQIIQLNYREMDDQSLTCHTYNCMRENRPNFVFMHYKQANKLQKLIAKHHCPEFKEDVKKNVATEKQSVMVETKGALVPLDDWVRAKIELLELALELKADIRCQGTTREIEDDLFACPDETLLLSGQGYTRQIPF